MPLPTIVAHANGAHPSDIMIMITNTSTIARNMAQIGGYYTVYVLQSNEQDIHSFAALHEKKERASIGESRASARASVLTLTHPHTWASFF